MLRELIEYRELLWMLAWRDIRARYRHTMLGAAWAVTPAVATMLIFVFVFQHAMGLKDVTGSSGVPYPLFALAGLVPWTFFTSGVTGAMGSLVSNRTLVTKIYFPREVFPLSAIGTAAADFLVSMVVLGLVIGGYALWTPWTWQAGAGIWWLPVVVAVQVMLMAGLGYLLSLGNLYFRDVGFVIRAMLPLMMFVTNVLYPLRSSNPSVAWVIRLNPMVGLLDGYRAALFGEVPFPIGPMLYAAALAATLLVAGWTLFHRSEHTFAEAA